MKIFKSMLGLLLLNLLLFGGAQAQLQSRPGAFGAYYVDTLPKQPLSKEEIADLLHMREEEKLARDVYLKLAEIYPFPIFRNISKAEIQHMRMIGLLIKKYGLKDPVAESGGVVGVFKDKKLQELYNSLINQGKKSMIDALKVGATIEDLDIKDLEEALKRTDNKDIAFVYNNLKRASENHIRAFVTVLRGFGGNYTPKYLSQSEFDRIISSKTVSNTQPPPGFYLISSGNVEGKVVDVKQLPGYGRRNIYWWTVFVDTGKETVEVRVAPVWWYSNLNIKKGDKVKVTGYRPPYWVFRGLKGLMVCRLEDLDSGAVYDFSGWRGWCRRISNLRGVNSNLPSTPIVRGRRTVVLKGTVESVSKEFGFRRKNVVWWVVRLRTSSGLKTVYVAPTWRLPDLKVSVGDSVEVGGFIPPVWRRLSPVDTYMACYLYDLTSGSKLNLKRCP